MANKELKKELHEKIDTIEDDGILEKIKELIQLEIITSQAGDGLKPYTHEEVLSFLAESEAQYKNGEYYTHEQVTELVKQWKKPTT